MFPVTIFPWFGSVNGDVVELQEKLFILSKMFLLPSVFINSLWITILDFILFYFFLIFLFQHLHIKPKSLQSPGTHIYVVMYLGTKIYIYKT